MLQADVICKQLGFNFAAGYSNKNLFGSNRDQEIDFIIKDIDCNYKTKEISDCRFKFHFLEPGYEREQESKNVAGVVCSNPGRNYSNLELQFLKYKVSYLLKQSKEPMEQ